MKCFYCLLLLLCTYVSHAQHTLYPLSVGEKMLPLKIKNVINHTAPSIDLAESKGKLLLLDFMYTTCGSCLRSLAGMDSLQQEFAGQIQVLAVSPQPLLALTQFLKKSVIGSRLKIPFVAKDTLLKSLFPHEFVSHVAWIGPDGIVKAITGADYVNAENIRKILDGQAVSWPVKKDEPDFDFTQPMMAVSQQLLDMHQRPIASSSLFSYLPGVRPYVEVTADTALRQIRYQYVNMSLPQMLKILFRKWDITNSRIVIPSSDSTRFEFDPRKTYRREWYQANLFCFEAIVPANDNSESLTARVARDITARFNVTASFVKVSVESLVLRRSGATLVTRPREELSVTLWDAVEALNSHFTRMPVIDSVGDIQNIILPISKAVLANIGLVKAAIIDAGYQLDPEQREMEMLVIKQLF